MGVWGGVKIKGGGAALVTADLEPQTDLTSDRAAITSESCVFNHSIARSCPLPLPPSPPPRGRGSGLLYTY